MKNTWIFTRKRREKLPYEKKEFEEKRYRKNPLVAINKLIIYCDLQHRKSTIKELSKRFALSEATIIDYHAKMRRIFKEWKNENKDIILPTSKM